MDEEAALLSVVPIKKWNFYKNNDNRKYEFLKTYKEILSDYELSPKIINIVREINDISKELDKKLGVDILKFFICHILIILKKESF